MANGARIWHMRDQVLLEAGISLFYLDPRQLTPSESHCGITAEHYSIMLWYTTLSAPFANFATTVTKLVPDVPAKVPLAPGLVTSVPFCAPLTETVSSVISPTMQVLAITDS